ncbi:LuxR family transcriptional regulator [Neorhizobium sp. P12A]|uniref:LuxR family transcriptional regulator n=1 Tax=Rhizobium/Agrobacterium group TaxID=227290 RepID=UPI00104ABD34|nr:MULTISPECIES: LuxR family transcriptional regulator [Rhizobium/Agrobacterium group]KAA0698831.1 LuxR family transcriptional regulator [Neorhizobium sp. P12A]TCR90146.1 LuxR family transcriptional regulator [Rhizobium sp. BK376]
MNIHSLIQLLVVMEECKVAENVVAELERVLRSYKFDFYGLLRQPKPNTDPMSLVLAGRWPEKWPLVYIAKKYVLIDPTIRFLARAQRPFRWRDTIAAFRADPHRRRMEQMMVDARSHGLLDGYIFPIHGRNGLLGNMTIGGSVVDLSPIEIALFEAVAKKAFWRMLELKGEAEALEAGSVVDTQMTRREMEVLNYLADGMTSIEISKLLKISNHTVDWYMNGIQDKLKAKNRQHIVALAFRYGLIS